MNQSNIPLVQIHVLAADRPQFKGADARTQKHADNDPGTVFVELVRLGAGQQLPDLVLGINVLEMLLIGHVRQLNIGGDVAAFLAELQDGRNFEKIAVDRFGLYSGCKLHLVIVEQLLAQIGASNVLLQVFKELFTGVFIPGNRDFFNAPCAAISGIELYQLTKINVGQILSVSLQTDCSFPTRSGHRLPWLEKWGGLSIFHFFVLQLFQ